MNVSEECHLRCASGILCNTFLAAVRSILARLESSSLKFLHQSWNSERKYEYEASALPIYVPSTGTASSFSSFANFFLVWKRFAY